MEKEDISQNEVESLVVVTENSKDDECAQESTFDLSGAIVDPALLAAIQREQPLGPIDTLKLAEFFGKFPTNIILAESLRVSALTSMLAHPQIAKDVQATFQFNSSEFQDQAEDDIPNEWHWPWQPPTNDENAEDPGDHGIWFIAINLTPTANQDQAAVSAARNVGLVIQSIVVDAEKTLYFVVGLSPAPETLPLAGLKTT